MAELRSWRQQRASTHTVERVTERVVAHDMTHLMRLVAAHSLAAHALELGARAGDTRWHGGEAPFALDGIVMCAERTAEYTRTHLMRLLNEEHN